MTQQETKWLSPDSLGYNPTVNPDNNKSDIQYIYPETVTSLPAYWRTDFPIDYNTAILNKPKIIFGNLLITSIGLKTFNIGFAPKYLFIKAIPTVAWYWYSESQHDGTNSYNIYIANSTGWHQEQINNNNSTIYAVDATNTIIAGKTSFSNNWFAFNVSTLAWWWNVEIHYTAYS